MKATNRMTCCTVISYKYLKLISAGGLSGGLNDVGSISDSEFGMCESRGEIMRVLRSSNLGSDVPKLQSMSLGNTQKLRSLISVPSAPRERPHGRLRPLLRLARHGVIFWDLRPRVPTAKYSHNLPSRLATYQTQGQKSFEHRTASLCGPQTCLGYLGYVSHHA